MTMLINLPSIDYTALAAQASVKLGETPFQIGGNALLYLTAPIGGSGIVTLEGSPDGTTWSTIRTLNAAQTASRWVELTNLPKYFRTTVTTVGTGSAVPSLHGVQ